MLSFVRDRDSNMAKISVFDILFTKGVGKYKRRMFYRYRPITGDGKAVHVTGGRGIIVVCEV